MVWEGVKWALMKLSTLLGLLLKLSFDTFVWDDWNERIFAAAVFVYFNVPSTNVTFMMFSNFQPCFSYSVSGKNF